LKLSGYLILTTPNRMRFSAWPRNLKYWLKREKIVPGPTEEHVREYTPKELCKILEEVGFDVLRLDFIALNPYLLPIPDRVYKVLDKISDCCKILKLMTKWDMIIVARR